MNAKINWPAICHGIAFIIAFDVRYLSSAVSMWWVFPFILGCGLMVFDGDPMPRKQPMVILWALTVLLGSYVTAIGMAAQGLVWALLAMPMLAICMKPKYLNGHIAAFGIIVGLYAIMLIVELATGFQTPNPATQYRFFALTGAWGYLKASAWPMIDPNNAALVINCALIPCFWKAIQSRQDRRKI